jgi:hypothetical protein
MKRHSHFGRRYHMTSRSECALHREAELLARLVQLQIQPRPQQEGPLIEAEALMSGF